MKVLRGYDRSLYGFKISAKIKAWILRRSGFETVIRHELVKENGETLRVIEENRKNEFFYSMSFLPYFKAWPNVKFAFVVYSKLKEEPKPPKMNHCPKCGNADNFEWEEIQKGKPWLIKCLECGHSWIEGEGE